MQCHFLLSPKKYFKSVSQPFVGFFFLFSNLHWPITSKEDIIFFPIYVPRQFSLLGSSVIERHVSMNSFWSDSMKNATDQNRSRVHREKKEYLPEKEINNRICWWYFIILGNLFHIFFLFLDSIVPLKMPQIFFIILILWLKSRSFHFFLASSCSVLIFFSIK